MDWSDSKSYFRLLRRPKHLKSSSSSPYLQWSKHEDLHLHKVLITHISVRFPAENQKGKPQYTKSWGIAWALTLEANGQAYGFISTILQSKVPETPVKFFEHFLEHLRQCWNKLCFDLDTEFEKIVSPPVSLQQNALSNIPN